MQQVNQIFTVRITLITLLRIPYLGRIGSTKLVLPKWHKYTVFLIELSEYNGVDVEQALLQDFQR